MSVKFYAVHSNYLKIANCIISCKTLIKVNFSSKLSERADFLFQSVIKLSLKPFAGQKQVKLDGELCNMASNENEKDNLEPGTDVTSETLELSSGGCAGIDEPGWSHKFGELGIELTPDELEVRVQYLRQQLLQNPDVKNVRDALRNCGVSEREDIIKLVKRYNFDSPGILFTPDNYDSWRKLANNDGTINDARYLVHEIAEVKELERIKQQKQFDYMGKGMKSMTRRQKQEWAIDFKIYYMQAHSKALEAEYEFIANQVSVATNGMISISRIVAAAVDPNRDEARAFMLVDGIVLEKHPNFSIWQQRGEETLQLNRNQRLKLKLLANPTLVELVRVVKQKRISQL